MCTQDNGAGMVPDVPHGIDDVASRRHRSARRDQCVFLYTTLPLIPTLTRFFWFIIALSVSLCVLSLSAGARLLAYAATEPLSRLLHCARVALYVSDIPHTPALALSKRSPSI